MSIKVDSDISEGSWVSYNEDVKIKIRPLTPEKMREASAKYTTKKKYGRNVEEKIDTDKLDLFLNDYIIMDWKGFVFGDDNAPFPCNKENKNFIMNKFSDVKIFILEKSNNLAEEMATIEQEEEKN